MINRRSIQVSPSLNIFIKPEDNIDNKQKNILNLKDKLVNEFDQDKYNLEECFSSDDKMNIGILFDKISQLINILSSNKEHNFCISNVQYYKNILEEAKENALFIEKIFNPPPYEKDKKRLSVPPIISIYNDDGKFIAANDIYLKLNKLESIIRAKEIDAKGEGELMKYIYPKSYEKVLKQIPLIIDSGGYRYYDLIAERTGRNLRWNSIRNNIYGGSVRIAEDVTKRPFFRFSLGQEKIINKLEIMPLHFHDLIKHFYSLIKMFIRPEEVKIILDKRPDIKVIGLKDVSGQVKNIVSEIINNNSNIQLKSLTLENFIELVKINIEFERIFNKLAYIASIGDIAFNESPFIKTIYKDGKLIYANRAYFYAIGYSKDEILDFSNKGILLQKLYKNENERKKAEKKLTNLKPGGHYNEIFILIKKDGLPCKISWDTHGIKENLNLRIGTTFLL